MYYFETVNGKKILKSDLITEAQCFFTTRETVIKSAQEGMADSVLGNKKLLCEYLEVSSENFISPNQTHSGNVEVVCENKYEYPETDGLILTRKNIAVFLNFADCTPLIFYDERQNIGAVSHAGWRGTAAKIGVTTAEKLIKEFGSSPEDIKVLIGPAISKCCYNVGEEVFRQLKNTVKNFENLYEIRNDNIYVDLKNINKTQLNEIGIEKIDVCPYCTCCDNDNFFSYRKENGTTSRHSAVLRL